MRDVQWSTVKMLAIGAAIGAVAMPILGFQYFGWVRGSTAEKMAEDASQDTAISLLTPQCVDSAKAEPDKLSDFQKQNNWKRRSFVEDAGWAVYPQDASSNLKRSLAEACAKQLASL